MVFVLIRYKVYRHQKLAEPHVASNVRYIAFPLSTNTLLTRCKQRAVHYLAMRASTLFILSKGQYVGIRSPLNTEKGRAKFGTAPIVCVAIGEPSCLGGQAGRRHGPLPLSAGLMAYFSMAALRAARASLSPRLVDAAWFWIAGVSSRLAFLAVAAAFFSARASAR